jgi:hypothetical protein
MVNQKELAMQAISVLKLPLVSSMKASQYRVMLLENRLT